MRFTQALADARARTLNFSSRLTQHVNGKPIKRCVRAVPYRLNTFSGTQTNWWCTSVCGRLQSSNQLSVCPSVPIDTALSCKTAWQIIVRNRCAGCLLFPIHTAQQQNTHWHTDETISAQLYNTPQTPTLMLYAERTLGARIDGGACSPNEAAHTNARMCALACALARGESASCWATERASSVHHPPPAESPKLALSRVGKCVAVGPG